ncbi:MAG: hypothetical protein QOG05_4260, partial [Streptosporangiaceae bacterium]|nr:hypothetical protein [Streptosporangiaceae bacterium]
GRGEALADLASPSPGPPRPRPGHPRARAATRPRPGPGGSPASPPSAASAGPAGTGRASAPLRSPRLSGAWRGRLGKAGLLSRIRRGRPARLALRVLIAAAVSAVAITVDGSQPATPALITGAVTWLLLTARHDLAR